MKLWEFNKLKQIPNYFLFYGDHFYLDFYFEKLSLKGENVLKLYFDEVEIDKAKAYISQNSLFGDKNILIIKTEKWLGFKEIVKVVGDNYFYLFFYGDVKKVKPKEFNNNFVRFFKPDLKELILKSQNYMELKGIKNIDIYNLRHLIDRIDYRFIFREIDKLALVDNLTPHKIDELVFNYNETALEQFFDTIFLKQPHLGQLRTIIYQGEDEIRVVTALVRYLKNLYLFNLNMKIKGGSSVSKDVLGYQLPKQNEEIRKRNAFSLNEKQFLKLFELFFKVELQMKLSKDREILLFALFLELNQILRQ